MSTSRPPSKEWDRRGSASTRASPPRSPPMSALRLSEEGESLLGYPVRMWNALGEYPSLKERNTYLKFVLFRLAAPVLLIILGIVIGIHFPSYLSVYSRRPNVPVPLLPRSLPPPPLSLIPPTDSLPLPRDPIPNVVHYVYGLAPDPQPDFPYFAYLSMRSAMMVLKPEKIMFHCLHEPRGYWWDRVKNWEGWVDDQGDQKGMLEVVPARDVTHVGKDKRPVVHFAHKADIIRLEVLREHGGIYLDIDTFVIKPFADESLLLHDVVMGMEARQLRFGRNMRGDDEMDPQGLCNAVIIARKDADFLKIWIDSYEAFDENQWAVHSVDMPWQLARLYPTLITVLSERTFFWPLWTGDHIRAVYQTSEYDFHSSGQLAYHAWESKSKQFLRALNPSSIRTIDTSFTRMARLYRERDEEKRWKAHLRAIKSLQSSGAARPEGLTVGDEEYERNEVLEYKKRDWREIGTVLARWGGPDR